MTTEEAIWTLENGAWRDSLGDDMSDADKNPLFDALDTAISALRAQQQAEANEPLTLDELRQMYGDPVWFVRGECGWRRILACICVSAREEFALFDDGLSDSLADYGKTWLAYRHKTETHTTTCTATNQPCAMCQPGPCGSRKEANHGSN